MASSCNGVGTFNPVEKTCACPITHTGPECRRFAQPACRIDNARTLRPLFWVFGITRQLLPPALPQPTESSAFELGPLPCRCIRQLLEVTAAYRNAWALLPKALVCARDEGNGETLSELLDSGGKDARWYNMTLLWRPFSRTYKFEEFPLRLQQHSSKRSPAGFGPQLLPLSECVDACGRYGWCMADDRTNLTDAKSLAAAASHFFAPRQRGRCRCFPEAVLTVRGSCEPVRNAWPASDPRLPPSPHAPTVWGLHVGQPMLGHAAAVASKASSGVRRSGLPLYEASSTFVTFNFVRCPLECSSRGSCDLHGFCRCQRGFWGLDCGVTMGPDGRPVAWRFSDHAITQAGASPRIYMYDLDVAWRIGPQLLSELDFALTERLLRSPHREADPASADYYWILGPNLRPRQKLEYVRRRWPYLNRTSMPSGDGSDDVGRAARHILTILGERGVGDTDLKPPRGTLVNGTLRWPSHVDATFDPLLQSASERRGWLSLNLNGMSDLLGSDLPAGRAAAQPCHVCFKPGVDVVIPPPASTIDVPSCEKLRVITAATGTVDELKPTASVGSVPASPANGSRMPRQDQIRRDNLFFWAGRVVPSAHRLNPMYASRPNVRELILEHIGAPGFKIVNTFEGGRNASAAGVDTYTWMRRSVFCWVPPGQRYGDPRRHILAAFLGCVPVFSVPDGHHTLEELLPWPNMSLEVPPERLHELPAILRAVPQRTLQHMRRRLRCARRYLWYASIYGACAPGLGREEPDAFQGLMRVLATRLEASRGRAAAGQNRVCL